VPWRYGTRRTLGGDQLLRASVQDQQPQAISGTLGFSSVQRGHCCPPPRAVGVIWVGDKFGMKSCSFRWCVGYPHSPHNNWEQSLHRGWIGTATQTSRIMSGRRR
jgi:hypothetical protein